MYNVLMIALNTKHSATSKTSNLKILIISLQWIRVQMYYGSGTVAHTASQWRHTRSAQRASGQPYMQQRAAGRRPCRHLKSMTSSMHIYLKNNSAKFHPDPIWNDGVL